MFECRRQLNLINPTLAAQELLKINVAQGLQDTVNSQSFMGRCVIDIGKFSKTPNTPVDDWCAAFCMLRSVPMSVGSQGRAPLPLATYCVHSDAVSALPM